MSKAFVHHNKIVSLRNHTCIYCGCARSAERPFTREHVIGRNFVPAGILKGEWNLIANACKTCNDKKANLEDDISAILLNDPFEPHEPQIAQAASKKARNSGSRRTKKPVADSMEQLTIDGRFGRASMSFNMLTPPQIDPERIDALAFLHLQAFVYCMTYDASARTGRFVEDAASVADARMSDWGNERFQWFAQHTATWEEQLRAIGAGGYFKLLIRGNPTNPKVGSFALEWNKRLRVVGFLGPTAGVDHEANQAPELQWKRVDQYRRMRTEMTLAPEADTLFSDAKPH